MGLQDDIPALGAPRTLTGADVRAARAPDLDPATRDRLLQHEHWMIRSRLAERPDLNDDDFLTLAQDPSPAVRRAILNNPFCPEDAKTAAALLNM